MNVREATAADISAMHTVRMSVKENALSNPGMVTEKDYPGYLFEKGKGWVAEWNGIIVGFCIVDVSDQNIWALFVQPGYEAKGIGRSLHDAMLDWFYDHHDGILWLGTAPGTRAEYFYTKAGWTNKGIQANGETRFEMTRHTWLSRKKSSGLPIDRT